MGARKILLDAARLFVITTGVLCSAVSFGQAIPQKNVNAIGPTPINWYFAGNPRMQQNEPACAVSPNNPEWLACGFNDYRGVNDPAIGDAFMGLAMSRDRGKSWISGLAPGHLKDSANTIGKKFGADANLEALPNLLLYNYIAGWRDDSQPGGIYLNRYYEHNREVGPPWEFLDIIEIELGMVGKFLDKPAFDVALQNPQPGNPEIEVPIPEFNDPRNPANSHPAYTLKVPSARLHLCYTEFFGDKNNGTNVFCSASDDGGVTWPIRNKISGNNKINQGVSIATANFGKDVLAVWRRFPSGSQGNAIMYAFSKNGGDSWSKARVLTEFCPFDQGTGPARFRTNALPVATSNGHEFSVYFASRNGAGESCFLPQPHHYDDDDDDDLPVPPQEEVSRMSTVAKIDDFDSFGEERDSAGKRIIDGKVRTVLNYSRIVMVRGTPRWWKVRWGHPREVDPQEYPAMALNEDGTHIPEGSRRRGHQFMPAVESAGGIETVAWYDSRLDKLNTRRRPVVGGLVEDLVVHFEESEFFPASPKWSSVQVLPAGLYDIVPPPLDNLPPAENNIPLRRTLDVFAAQITQGGHVRPYVVDEDFYPDADGVESRSTRVSRYATRPTADGGREQVEFNYPNGRLFRKGKAPFIGDYNTVFAPRFRQRQDGTWIMNQSPVNPGHDLFTSIEPAFHIGWTSNRNVRGEVFYTGCDIWNETLQIWEAKPGGCNSDYTDPVEPVNMMIPLQGEDGSQDGPPLSCTMAETIGIDASPLTRNQNIFTAAMLPGITTNVVSAIKRPMGMVNTFVVDLDNGSRESQTLVLNIPGDVLMSFVRDVNPAVDPDTSITVTIPAGSSNARTIFDFSNELDSNFVETVVLTVNECLAQDNDGECTQLGSIVSQVPLERSSLTPLENVQSNPSCTDPSDPTTCDDPVDLTTEGEAYDLILQREQVVENLDLENLDLENLDLENTVFMLDLENLDLENLDLENRLVFLDLENLDLENLDLENALYENLDLENLDLENRGLFFLDLENLDLENTFLQFLDLENLDLENLDLENLDLENLDLENLDLENLDLENLDLENFTVFASDLENLDLENLDLENAAPTDNYTEVTWTASSSTNTTTGVDVKPIFSPDLVEALNSNPDFQVLLTVRQPYLVGTVVNNELSLQFCAPQVVAENQLVYASLLDESAINSLTGDPDPNVASTPSFVLNPDQKAIITLRYINPPSGFNAEFLDDNSGVAVYSQPGTENCDPELTDTGADIEACEIDYVEPDDEPPVLTLNGPADISIEAGFPYTDAGVTVTDNRDDVIDAVQTSNTVDTNVPGDYEVVWTATDEAGNSASITRIVRVIDSTSPVITLNGDNPIILEAGDSYVEAGATASDLVDDDAALTAAIEISGTVQNETVGSYELTYRVSDTAGNEADPVIRTVQVVDNTPPTVIAPADVSFEASGQLTPLTEAEYGTAQASDNSDTVNVSNDAPAAFPVGTTVITWTATDGTGNSATATQTITITDTTAPVLTLPATFTTEAVAELTPLGIADFGQATATDNSENVTVTLSAPDAFPVGTTPITWTATDGSGNSVSEDQLVVITDTTLPLVTAPPNVSVEARAALTVLSAAELGTATATDNSGNVSVSSDAPPAGFPVGLTTVTWTATDGSGNSATTTQQVTITDTTVPVIELIGDETVTVEAGIDYEDAGATATDIVDGDLSNALVVTSTVNTAVVGSYTVSYDVSDANQNAAATVVRTVIVEDTTAPVITGGSPPVFDPQGPYLLEPGETQLSLSWPVSAQDLEAGLSIDCTLDSATATPVSSSYDPATQTLTTVFSADFQAGTTEGQCTVTDQGGNSVDTEPFSVLVEDIPIIELDGDLSAPLVLEAGDDYTDPGFSALDLVDGDITVSIEIDNPITVNSPPGLYTITYTVTDSAGNESEPVTRQVEIVDTTAPVITLLGNADVTLEAGEAYVDPGVTIEDAGDADIASRLVVDNPVNVLVAGDYTVTYNVTDASGNVADTVTRSVTVEDTTPPEITNPSPPVFAPQGPYLLPPGETTLTITWPITAQDLENGLSVSCSIDGVTLTPSSTAFANGLFTANFVYDFPAGNSTGTCAVTDQGSNTTTSPPFTVLIEDIPVLTLNGPSTVEVEAGEGFQDPGATAIDLVDGDISDQVIITGHVNLHVPGTYVLTYSVTDSAGNTAEPVTRLVNVVDTTPPHVWAKYPFIYVFGDDDDDRVRVREKKLVANIRAFDTVDGDVSDTASCLGRKAKRFRPGNYRITCSASDHSGNTGYASFWLKVRSDD